MDTQEKLIFFFHVDGILLEPFRYGTAARVFPIARLPDWESGLMLNNEITVTIKLKNRLLTIFPFQKWTQNKRSLQESKQ